MAIGLFVVGASTHQGLVSLAATFLPQIAVLFLAVTLGEVVRSRRALAAETAQRLRVAHEERETEAARRVAEERLRIARDLHDTVAHSMATITVQAGSALHLLDGGDTNLRRALTAIRATSKEALAEMRATLGQLRTGTSGDPQTLTGGLDRLPALCDAVTAAGAPVTVEVEGEQRPLPPAVDQAAYRILQESLTNVLRHAGQAARATVSLRYEPAALEIQVTDDGGQGTGHGGPGTDGSGTPNPARPAGDGLQPARGGHGLTGMAERAAAVGGKVTAGLRTGGGFEVAAWLPAGRRRGREMIRVLLADDQALVRAGFRALLESADDISVVAEAQNGGAAVALVRELTPDVVLMDLNMPEVDGLTATGRITADPSLAAVKVVVLTTFDDDEHVFAALRAGASGFLVKDIEPEELLQAVRVVARGDALLAPSVTRSLIAAFTRQPALEPAARAAGAGAGPGAPGASSGDARAVARQVGLASLTGREREVVALVAAGLSNDEIAARLVVSPLTAKTHVSRSMTKLAARDRAQLVVIAYEHGLAGPGGQGGPAGSRTG